MQFYKYEGFVKNGEWAEECDSRRLSNERSRRIEMKSVQFNGKLQGDGYYFTADISGTVKIGIIDCGLGDIERTLGRYLKAVGFELTDTSLEEITFKNLREMLRFAERNNFISDEEEVLCMYRLDALSDLRMTRGIDFGENLLDETDKKKIYSTAEHCLASGTFIPELDRIYAGRTEEKAKGHPVHYMIETDDREIRNGMYRTLLNALRENGRIKSKRYSFIDVYPGDRISAAMYDCLYGSSEGGAMQRVLFPHITDVLTERILLCSISRNQNTQGCGSVRKSHG